MRLCTITILAILTWSPCLSACAAESLNEYIAALEGELRTNQQAPLSRVLAINRPPSLDVRRLLQHSHSIIHAATASQRQRLSDAVTAFVPHYVLPANISPIPVPSEHLAFTEFHVIYSEILDRAGYLQRAHWAAGDKELLDAALRKLCSSPSTIDFYRRVLDGEISAGRYPTSAVPDARALSTRLAQRTAWYGSAVNLSTCRDLSRTRVAP